MFLSHHYQYWIPSTGSSWGWAGTKRRCPPPRPSSRGAGAPGYSPSAGTATPHSCPPYTILYVTINVPPQGRRLREQVQPTVRQQGQRFLTLLLHLTQYYM
jgi:hypothetical protein